MTLGEMLTQLVSAIGGLIIAWTMFQRYSPSQFRTYFDTYSMKLVSYVYPYIQIKFDEFAGDELMRSEAFSAIQNYLSAHSTKLAKRLKANVVKDSQALLLSMDEHEEVPDEFNGVKVWWASNLKPPRQSFSWYDTADEKRYFTLTFHKRDRELITGSYVKHVLKEGKAFAVKNRQRKLYTNNPSEIWYRYRGAKWSHLTFEHPATFDTLAMEEKKKKEIMNDLIKFRNGKEKYAKIGKAWKRGYLLYGPPGTGKSTMIAAIANFLDYDVYDLELTSVKNNSELRQLLIETSNKSVIVIEDIDCSLDLTGQRVKKKKKDENNEDNPIKKAKKDEEDNKISMVTLSGLLNSIDGLWSSCGGEKIIVFTTNYVDKLDPALIRRGRMDKHIEMSYCCFEAFKVLAKNYLEIESHELYAEVGLLLEETNMIPADVAENLMSKSEDEDVEACLKNLIEALKAERKKAEEEASLKAEKEEKEMEKSAREDVKEVKENEISAKEVKENGFIA